MQVSDFTLRDIISRLQSVKSILTEAVAAFNNMEAKYKDLKNYTMCTFEESRCYWTEKGEQGRSGTVENSAIMLKKIDELVVHVENVERALILVDKSYVKRKKSVDLKNRIVSANYPFSEQDDYFTKMQKVIVRMKELISKYAMTGRLYPIHEIILFLSSKHKAAYDELFDLICIAYMIRNDANASIPEVKEEVLRSIKKEVEDGFETAVQETAELIANIEDKQVEDTKAKLMIVSEALSQILSEKYIDTLFKKGKEFSCLGESFGAFNSFPEMLLIGSAGFDTKLFTSREETKALIRERYASVISDDKLTLPVLVSLREGLRLMISCEEQEDKKLIQQTFHSIIFSLLSTIPASKQHFILFDPEYRGRGFEPFLDFLNQEPEIMGQQVWTTHEQMYAQLENLSKYIDNFSQTKISKYENIFEYNQNVPENTEALKCLCVLDFPKNFDERMLEALINILKNGAICGVGVVLHFNKKWINNKYYNLEDWQKQIREMTTILDQNGNRLTFSNGIFFHPQKIIPELEMNAYLNDYRQRVQFAREQSIPLESLLEGNPWFSRKSDDIFSIPIGKASGGKVLELYFGKGSSHHGLIAGVTGSGKSTLLHTIIMSSMIFYSPEEVNLYLMDFKSGTEFKVYDTRKLPHIKLLAIDAKQEFGESILEELVVEMERRSQLFKENGEQTNLHGYRQHTGKGMPRIIVIMDEFQTLYNETSNRKVALHCADLTERLVREGRAYGIHFLMATQTLKAIGLQLSIQASTLEQMRVRIGLKCGDRDTEAMFSENSRDALEKMRGDIGAAVFNPEYTEMGNEAFRVAYCDRESQSRLLDELQKKSATFSSEKTRVFEGARVPSLEEIEKNEDLFKDLIDGKINIWLGEPIKIARPVCIEIDKRKRNNLLIVGGNEDMAYRIIGLYLINVYKFMSGRSLIEQNTAISEIEPVLFYMDGNIITNNPIHPFLMSTLNRFGRNAQIARSRYEFILMIDKLYDIFVSRRLGHAGKTNFITVIFNGIQWMDVLKVILTKGRLNQFLNETEMGVHSSTDTDICLKEDSDGRAGEIFNFLDDFSKSLGSNDKPKDKLLLYDKLSELFESGHTYGINFIIWSNDYNTVREYLYDFQRLFSHRILFSLNNSDADRLIEGAAVSGLSENTVLFSDSIRDAFQFKPFKEPTAAWIKKI
ncbi:MAG: FtsK/SpoIIIE domain-containing protein [Candidatus Humimicrobiaceae bacterium]